MLFILNKLDKSAVEDMLVLGGDDDKSVLLVSDAVYYGLGPMLEKLADLDLDDVYADESAVKARGLDVDSSVEVVDYDRMAKIIMDDHDRVVFV